LSGVIITKFDLIDTKFDVIVRASGVIVPKWNAIANTHVVIATRVVLLA
jgi:hypothetical protein